MRPKYLFSIISIVAVFAVILVMLATGFVPLKAETKTNPQAGIQDATVEKVEIQADAGASTSTTTESLESQGAPSPDGRALLNNRCARCHTTQSLEQIKKSPAEWEKVLAKMGAMGVHLDESEKIILIDYLAAADKP